LSSRSVGHCPAALDVHIRVEPRLTTSSHATAARASASLPSTAKTIVVPPLPPPPPPRPLQPTAPPTGAALGQMVAKVCRLVRGVTEAQVSSALHASSFNMSRAIDALKTSVQAATTAAPSRYQTQRGSDARSPSQRLSMAGGAVSTSSASSCASEQSTEARPRKRPYPEEALTAPLPLTAARLSAPAVGPGGVAPAADVPLRRHVVAVACDEDSDKESNHGTADPAGVAPPNDDQSGHDSDSTTMED